MSEPNVPRALPAPRSAAKRPLGAGWERSGAAGKAAQGVRRGRGAARGGGVSFFIYFFPLLFFLGSYEDMRICSFLPPHWSLPRNKEHSLAKLMLAPKVSGFFFPPLPFTYAIVKNREIIPWVISPCLLMEPPHTHYPPPSPPPLPAQVTCLGRCSHDR